MICYRFIHFHYNAETQVLSNIKNNTSTRLTQDQAALLSYFLVHPEQVLTKQNLLEKVWNNKKQVNAIATNLSKLRKQIGDNTLTPQFIETVPQQGFRFLPKVEVAEPLPLEDKPKHLARAINTTKFLPIAAILIILFSAAFVIIMSSDKKAKNLQGNEQAPQVSPQHTFMLHRYKSDNTQGLFQLYLSASIKDAVKKDELVQLTNDNYDYLHAIWGKDDNTVFAVRILNSNTQCDIVKISRANKVIEVINSCQYGSNTQLAFDGSIRQLYKTK